MSKKKTGFPSKDKSHLKGIPEEMLNPPIFPYSMISIFSKINEGHLRDIAIEADGVSYSKGRVLRDSMNVAASLISYGVGSGDAIVIGVDNCYEGIILMMGANAIGVKSVLVNEMLSLDEIYSQTKAFSPELYFLKRDFKVLSDKLFMQLEKRDVIVTIGPSEKVSFDFQIFLNSGNSVKTERVKAVIEKYAMFDDPTIFIQTSGSSSGKPKTLPFRNSAIYASLVYASNSTGTKVLDKSISRVLCIITYRVAYGWMTLFVNLLGGNQIVLASGLEAEDIAKYHEYQASYIYGTPAIFRAFMDLTPEDADLSSISAFFCAGFSLPETWFLEGVEFFKKHNSNAEIRNNYGIGEALCIGTASDGIPHKEGTSGKFYVGPKWLIVDEDLHEVKYEEAGELLVASPTLCDGYFHEEELTAKSFIFLDDMRYFRTGDLVVLHEDGYVSYLGRKNKRFYMPMGAVDKVNCETVENEILKFKLVHECAVIAVKDERGFEYGCAFVELLDKEKCTDDVRAQILKFLESKLLPFQMPERIIFIDDIPHMGSGKPDFKKLESMV